MAITESYVLIGTTNPSAADYTRQANKYAQMFKLYLDRSYSSGRGKIVNLSQTGLNDQYSLSDTYCSLWDANNQCKPAFYAVVNLGINYHALDSLISYADTLQESEYTTESWTPFAAALTSAKNAIDRNYSASVSAADALGEAKDNLEAAINGLVEIPSDVLVVNSNNPKVFTLSQNYPNPFNPSTIIRYDIPKNAYVKLTIYDMLGRVVTGYVTNETRPPSVWSLG
jgi:hypothetical protein